MIRIQMPEIIPLGELVAVPPVAKPCERMSAAPEMTEGPNGMGRHLCRALDVDSGPREANVLAERMSEVPTRVGKDRITIDDKRNREAIRSYGARHFQRLEGLPKCFNG